MSIKVDFEFFSAVKDLPLFEEKWAYEGAVCGGGETIYFLMKSIEFALLFDIIHFYLGMTYVLFNF